MNKTYISYGSMGASKKRSQMEQDVNAKSISKANYAERAVSKSKAAYQNSSWDLVDKVKDDKYAVSKIAKDDLPEELKGMTKVEIEAVVVAKAKERAAIQEEIEILAKKRQAYIDEENKKAKTEDDLGAAINNSILDLAREKGYVLAR
jgi:hypothetical protein